MRTYALTRLRPGDYVCPSNDGETLWRFRAYDDGAVMGLDVGYWCRTFWATLRTPMPRELPADLDELDWIWQSTHLSTRRDALASVFNEEITECPTRT